MQSIFSLLQTNKTHLFWCITIQEKTCTKMNKCHLHLSKNIIRNVLTYLKKTSSLILFKTIPNVQSMPECDQKMFVSTEFRFYLWCGRSKDPPTHCIKGKLYYWFIRLGTVSNYQHLIQVYETQTRCYPSPPPSEVRKCCQTVVHCLKTNI